MTATKALPTTTPIPGLMLSDRHRLILNGISIAGDAYELIELKQDYSHKDRILIFMKK